MLEWIKSHPLYDVLIAIGIFVLVYAVSRSSGGSSGGGVTYVQSGPSDALQQASIAASVAQGQTQAAVVTSGQQTQAAYNLGVLQQQTQQNQDAIAGKVASDQIGGQVDIEALTAQAQTTIAQTQANSQVQLAGITTQGAVDINSANQKTQQLQIAAGTQQLSDQLAADVHLADTNSALQENLSNTAASVILGQSNNNTSISLKQIDSATTLGQDTINATNLKNTLDAGTNNLAITTAGAVNSKAIDATVALGTQQLTNESQTENDNFNLNTLAITSNRGYLDQLVQLAALGKNPSGLPGVGTTTQNIDATRSSSGAQIITAIGNLAGNVLKGVVGF